VLARLAAIGKASSRSSANINVYMCMPAQRQAEVLGTLTHAQLPVLSNSLHYAPLPRHW